jgi:hypothetical protein
MSREPRGGYEAVADDITATSPATRGQMFGMPCLKNEVGKAFAGYFGEAMVFKLPPSPREEALALPGARLFDPSGMGRPMKEWVVVPAEHAERWPELAREALRNLDGARKG